jgi:hypothetical protein
MTIYGPAVRNIAAPWLYIVRQADPDFDREKRRELAYEFEAGNGRRFYINPMFAGAYDDDRNFIVDEFGRILLTENGAAIIASYGSEQNTLSSQDGSALGTQDGGTLGVE